jgi:carboxypeptidase Q
MNRTLAALTALSLVSLSTAVQGQAPSLESQADAAMKGDTHAWDFVEGITTEVGPRQAGTEAEARARAWATAWLKSNGFANVADEPFMMNTWLPGDVARARVTAPFAQDLVVLPLGNSAATPAGGIEAEVVLFRTVDELRAAPEGSLKGKIAYISHQMRPAQDGSHYGFAGPARWVGPGIAASKGAIATVIKSVGTDHHRNPHTGGTTFPAGVAAIPAGALSLPDAENLRWAPDHAQA